MCRIDNVGYFNGTVQSCYVTHKLSALCYIIDSTYSFEEGGCLDGQRTAGEILHWTSENLPHHTYPIAASVRSSYDPYVRAYKEGYIDLTQTSTELSVVGIVFVIGSCLLGILPIAFCISKCKKKSSPLMDMEVEMHSNRFGNRI